MEQIVLTEAEKEALAYAVGFLRHKGAYMKTAESVKRRAAIIKSLLARAGAEQETES